MPVARATLLVLAAAHAVAPWVAGLLPASRRLDTASLVLAAAYAYLSYDSVRGPRRAFWAAFALLAVVTVVAAWKGAAPAGPVWVAAWLALAVLAHGALAARPSREAEDRG